MAVVAAQPFSMSRSMAASASAALVVALRSACLRRVVVAGMGSVFRDDQRVAAQRDVEQEVGTP